MDGQTTITINGKAIGLRFNYQAVIETSAIKGTSNTSKNIISIIWGGIMGHAFVKQQEPEITFEELVDWYEEINMAGTENDDLKKVLQAFESSRVFKEKIQPEIEKHLEDAKKNLLPQQNSSAV